MNADRDQDQALKISSSLKDFIQRICISVFGLEDGRLLKERLESSEIDLAIKKFVGESDAQLIYIENRRSAPLESNSVEGMSSNII